MYLGKWFTTRFTFVIFVAFMNCMDVFLQSLCTRKWFSSRFTFVIFGAFMNSVNVCLQISCLIKRFATYFTIMIFINSMNCILMQSQTTRAWVQFITSITLTNCGLSRHFDAEFYNFASNEWVTLFVRLQIYNCLLFILILWSNAFVDIV